eukprot:TRINITY_DN2511_c0_g1_i1.p3 TRINITY_DN2511_c0_g1~~TRINITY_DN2511_c0_g1_i1.p3  ORF type:complete len:203 (+),score=87.63 TRINITY_DN2511_c0_g1_i1:59-667(+)
MEAPMPPGMLTEEEERWLMAQMEEEEEDDSDDEHDEDGVLQQRIMTTGGGAGGEMTAAMEAEMLHFLNATGQQTERSDHTQQAPPPKAGGYSATGEAEEKRLDVNDGNFYTKAEFQAFYGSLETWRAAPPEKRLDTDEQAYTLHDFLSFYGEVDGAKRWGSSKPQQVCKNIQYGPCKYGGTCKYMHPEATASHNKTYCPPKQ